MKSSFPKEEIRELVYGNSWFSKWVKRLGRTFNPISVFIVFFSLAVVVGIAFRYDGILTPAGISTWSSIVYPRILGVFFFSNSYRLLLIFVVVPSIFSMLSGIYAKLPQTFEDLLSNVSQHNYNEVKKKFDGIIGVGRKERNFMVTGFAIMIAVTSLSVIWILTWRVQADTIGFFSRDLWSLSKAAVLLYNLAVVFILSYSLSQYYWTFSHFKQLLSLTAKSADPTLKQKLRQEIALHFSIFKGFFITVLVCLALSITKNVVSLARIDKLHIDVFLNSNFYFILYYSMMLVATMGIYTVARKQIESCIEGKKERAQFLSVALWCAGLLIAIYIAPYLLLSSDWKHLYGILLIPLLTLLYFSGRDIFRGK